MVGSNASEAADAPKRFIQHANNGGGHDNITAIVVRIESPDPMVYASKAADLANKVTVLKGMRLPDWAKQALAAGWKMPKGWKP